MLDKLQSVPQCILDCRNRLGESILWDDRRAALVWTNIHDCEIWIWQPSGQEKPEVHHLPERVGALGLCESGALIVALEKGFALFEPETGVLRRLTDVDVALPSVRLNDGRVDPAGRFLAGGMDEASPQQPLATLYGYGANAGLMQVVSGIHCTNSLCWNSDGSCMYFTDMPSRTIEVFDYDRATGAAYNRRPFAKLDATAGLPDGSVTDAEDHLWNAEWLGRKLVRYRPDGSVERVVSLSVSNPTCMTFGGPDLDILFVTSAWFGLDAASRAAEPEAGGIFAFRPGVKGRREPRYSE